MLINDRISKARTVTTLTPTYPTTPPTIHIYPYILYIMRTYDICLRRLPPLGIYPSKLGRRSERIRRQAKEQIDRAKQSPRSGSRAITLVQEHRRKVLHEKRRGIYMQC